MDKITNLEELKLQQEKLRVKAIQQEYNLNLEFTAVKAYYSPVKILKRALSGMFTPSENQGMAAGAAGMGISVLMERLLLKNQPLLIKLIGSYVGGNLATKSFGGIGGKIASFVGGFLGKKKTESSEDDETLGI